MPDNLEKIIGLVQPIVISSYTSMDYWGGKLFPISSATGGSREQYGNRRVKVAPAPGVLWHSMVPAIPSASFLTKASPSPLDDSPPVGRAPRRVYLRESFFGRPQ
jgi:hypothetical protein